MTTQLLIQLWQTNQNSVLGPIRKLSPDNYRNRLMPTTASAGFIALHTAEAMHRFAQMIFNREPTILLQATGGVMDEGNLLDLPTVLQTVNESFAMVEEQIRQTTDEQWAEPVASPFGEASRMQVLAFLMHHNSYHAGQIAQAIKKGRVFVRNVAASGTIA
ncbi:DinB family protein [Spirosoma taeanense]|uniref:DinB family protein n=1 Tax=Spirosoma taeanense TaxID=2735870 RepID=A0A6M5Y540_9BACT|nr:DinB family protein [Spirosoma taeanense]QJW88480.1 DinB family protein [Spirosoma taeanense]